MAGLDLAAELLAHRHLAIADAEHGNAERKDLLRGARRVRFGDAGRTAGENDCLRRRRREDFFRLVVRDDLAIDAGFAHAPRNELGHLRTEIDDEYGSCHDGIYWLPPLLVQRSGFFRFIARHPFLVLRQIIGNRPPWRARRCEYMQHRANTWVIVQQAGRNADGWKVQRLARRSAAADAAMFTDAAWRRLIVCQHVGARGKAELVGIDMRIGREGGAAQLAADRAMARRERADFVD